MTPDEKPEVSPGSFHIHCRNYTGALVTVSLLVAFLFVADLYTLTRLDSTQDDEKELRIGLS